MNNRANILNCALQLFALHGYDAVGVQEIVEAAGITKPTLYHYFGNKQGLLETLLNEYSEQLLSSVTNAVIYERDLPRTLTRIATAYFNFAQANSTFYRLQLSTWFAPPASAAYKVVARINEKQYRLLEDLFIRAVEQHGNMRGRHQAYAATFLGMLNNYISLFLNGYTQLSDELVHQAVHQFMYGIFS
ncbi:MAG TPA: TetR/AcrR family transcriptional regulator [Chloroflexia bacterium]|nr:TetR/AcrR family transcriptional regulator [Chloroflexia bacterium]